MWYTTPNNGFSVIIYSSLLVQPPAQKVGGFIFAQMNPFPQVRGMVYHTANGYML